MINQYEPLITDEMKCAVTEYMESGGWITEFRRTREFEDMIAKYVGAKYAVVVTSGTAALFLALAATPIEPYDEVLVPDFTMVATPNAAKMAGGTPVLVDIDPVNLCMNLSKAKDAITKDTVAMIYVSINGRCGNMDEVAEFAEVNELWLIEDAAQSFGSRWNGTRLGTFGDMGCYSFGALKTVTTGQGGAIVTDDYSIYKELSRLKDFGRDEGGCDVYKGPGWNFKFTDLQAVLGIAQMEELDGRLIEKRRLYDTYRGFLPSHIQLIDTDLTNTVPWFVDILVEDRDQLIGYLKAHDISSRPFYPPMHTVHHLSGSPNRYREFPIATEVSRKGLWLPSSPTISNSEVYNVCKAIKEFYQ